MSAVPDRAKILLITLVVCYVYGLIGVVVWFGMISLIVGHLPRWPWWQFALAPLMLGLLELAAERFLGPSIRRFHAWHGGIPQWQKAVFLVLLLLGGIGLIVMIEWLSQ